MLIYMAVTKTITSLEELQVFAREVSEGLAAGDVLLLSGNLGTGKTAFVKALAKALGVVEDVTSPTFTIIGEYEIPDRDDITWLVHMDLYRVPGEEENVDEPYLQEVIETAKAHKRIVAIEWPERLPDVLPKNSKRLTFSYGENEDERVVEID